MPQRWLYEQIVVPVPVGIDLKEHVKIENKNGGRLRVSANTQCPKEGPLRLTGRNSRGQRLKIVGDEEFVIRMILAGRETVPVAVELGLVSPDAPAKPKADPDGAQPPPSATMPAMATPSAASCVLVPVREAR